MRTQRRTIRAIAFIDGQNLFHSAKVVFGYAYPNFDVLALSELLCRRQGWELAQARFYTGVPDVTDDPFWHGFWLNKLAMIGRRHIHVFQRPLRRHHMTAREADAAVDEAMRKVRPAYRRCR